MKKAIKITISEPCSQSWENMTIVGKQERHCASCSKNVIDFSTMTDTELLHFFKDNKGGICGKFSIVQTDRLIQQPLKTPPMQHLSTYFARFIGLFMSFSLKAQTTDTLKKQPLMEITPLTQQPMKPITSKHTKDTIPLTCHTVEPLFIGTLGGCCIQFIEPEDKSKAILKNNVFSRIEDILRYF